MNGRKNIVGIIDIGSCNIGLYVVSRGSKKIIAVMLCTCTGSFATDEMNMIKDDYAKNFYIPLKNNMNPYVDMQFYDRRVDFLNLKSAWC